MKTKNLFVISPHHYCHSTATIIEGLNKLDGIKVFSNADFPEDALREFSEDV